MSFALSPWQMWGTSTIVTSHQRGGQSQQVARVNYGRPETWSFFLGARILTLDNPTALNNVSIAVQWQLVLGLGRDSFQTPTLDGPSGLAIPSTVQPFAFFCWRDIPPNTDPSAVVNNPRYTTQSRTAPLDDSDATSKFPIDWFCAQDIQCSALVTQSSNIIVSCTVELTAFFAPRSHVRPEWYADDEGSRFRGQEQGGS